MLNTCLRATIRAGFLVFVLALTAGCAQAPVNRAAGVQRMYVFNCGEAQIPDVSPWSPGVNVGKPAVFSDNCYLIAHGNDLMLWDSGYSDAIAATPGGVVGPRSTAVLKKTLAAQMAELGIKPEQVTHIAFSHTHSDHVGNANMFTSATLYIQQAEYDAAFGTEPAKFGFVAANYDKLRASPVVKLNGDHDVFGDGSVLILSTPDIRRGTNRCSYDCRRPASSCCRVTPRISRRISTTAASRGSISTRNRACSRWTNSRASSQQNMDSCGSTTTVRRALAYRTRHNSSIEAPLLVIAQ